MPALSAIEEVRTGVKAVIDTLTLTGIAAVVIEDEPQRNDRTLPYVSVTIPPATERLSLVVLPKDDVEYPIQVSIVARKADTEQVTLFGWRQTIRRRFSNQHLLSGAVTMGTENGCRVVPITLYDKFALDKFGIYLSILMVYVTVREPRT